MGINIKGSFKAEANNYPDSNKSARSEQTNDHMLTKEKQRVINEFGKVARLFCEQGIYSEEKVKDDLSRVENQVIKFGEKNETNASAVAEKVVPEIFLQRAFSLYEDAPVVTASDANVFDDQNNRIDSVIFINDENNNLLPFGIDVTVSHRLSTIRKKIHLSSNDISSDKPFGMSKLEYLTVDNQAIKPFDIFRFCIAVDSNNLSEERNSLMDFVILSEMKEQLELASCKNDETNPGRSKMSETGMSQARDIENFVLNNLDVCINSLLEGNEDILDFATNPENPKQYSNNYDLIKDYLVTSGFDRAYNTLLNVIDSEKKDELVCMLYYSTRDGETYLKDKRIFPLDKIKAKYNGHFEELAKEPDGECKRILSSDYHLLKSNDLHE